MTRGQYIEMCELLEKPVEEDLLPVELEDFPAEIHEAYNVYHLLPDRVDYFSGNTYGKALEHINTFISLINLHQSKQEILKLVILINSIELENKQRKK